MDAAEPLLLEETPQEFTFPDARGGRRPFAPLSIEVIRALEPGDIQALSGAVAAPAQRLLQIRHSHHRLAQLLCEGRDQAEVSLITGYAPSYISLLQGDPAFQELLQYYAIQRGQVYVDVLERLKTLGITSTEEIQRRLSEAPEKFSNRELAELAEMALIKPVAAANAGKGAGPGAAAFPAINISFAVPQGPQVLDITPRENS